MHINLEEQPVGTRVVCGSYEMLRMEDRIRITSKATDGGEDGVVDIFPGGRTEIVSGRVLGPGGRPLPSA